MSCVGCVDRRSSFATLLGDAAASLMRAQTYLRPTVIPEPRQIRAARQQISGLWRQHRSIQERMQGSQQPLGLLTLVVVGIGGAISVLSAWALKHKAQAREVEARAELYNRMLEEGLSPSKAATLAMGAGSQLSEVLGKIVLIALVLGGLYVTVKIIK